MVNGGGVAGIVVGIVIGVPLVVAALIEVYIRSTARKFDVKGKHVYITGGSKGLGKSLARMLLERGANITIVASQQTGLDSAIKELQPFAKNDQTLIALKADLTDETRAIEVFHEAVAKQGNVPEYVFCCAGYSIPKFFLDVSIKECRDTMNLNFMAAMITAHTALKEYMKSGQKGNIIFVSSLVGMFSIIGYSSYSPSKFALRGLADSLRSEFAPFGIKIHIFFPATIDTEGYAYENTVKPDILREIEKTDSVYSPDHMANALVKGVERGDFLISSEILGYLACSSSRCASPGNNFIIDSFFGIIGWIGFPIWRIITDIQIASWAKKEHKLFPSSTDKLI